MKKIYLVALLFISAISFAQGVEFVEGDASYKIGDPESIFVTVDGHVVNNSTETTTVTWTREIVYMVPGWSSQVCDNFLCYEAAKSTGTFTIAPQESLVLKLQLGHNDIAGCSTLKMIITAPGLDGDEMLYHARLGEECDIEFPVVSGIDDAEDLPTLSLYPNPVINELNVDLQNFTEASFIEIYNLTGKRIDRIFVDRDEELRLDAYGWNEGMYILSVLDENERVLETQRFSKVQ